MRAGLITFHESNNYGAILQAYALLNKIRKFCSDAEIINYKCKNKRRLYALCDIGRHRTLKKNIRALIKLPFNIVRRIKVNKAKSRLYKLSPKTYYSKKELKKDAQRWGHVVCGSDQIWNYNNTGFDPTYLLDFIDDNDKKIAYAASTPSQLYCRV